MPLCHRQQSTRTNMDVDPKTVPPSEMKDNGLFNKASVKGNGNNKYSKHINRSWIVSISC